MQKSVFSSQYCLDERGRVISAQDLMVKYEKLRKLCQSHEQVMRIVRDNLRSSGRTYTTSPAVQMLTDELTRGL